MCSSCNQQSLLLLQILHALLYCRLFEPFTVQIMGRLLDRFGDGTPFVRAANDHASQAIMANLSNYGVPQCFSHACTDTVSYQLPC